VMNKARWLVGALLSMLAVPGAGVAAEPIIIPFVTDPSPMIDGNLAEWTTRGALRELVGREHATFSPEGWRGDKDLSGWVRFGHDADNLYVAAHVVDDVFVQDQASVEAWRGDHIMLTIDMKRSGRIQDIWQLGLSPGGLAADGASGGGGGAAAGVDYLGAAGKVDRGRESRGPAYERWLRDRSVDSVARARGAVRAVHDVRAATWF